MLISLLTDSVLDTIIHLAPVLIIAGGQDATQTPLPYYRHGVIHSMEMQALPTIRKGSSFASDLYFEGFKAYDFPVLIEGERVHNSCPNRMDAPIIKINPLEVEKIKISTDPAYLQGGLGGYMAAERRTPSYEPNTAFYLTGNFLSSYGADLGIRHEWKNNGVYLRVAAETPYYDASGTSIITRYKYLPTVKWMHQVGDLSFRRATNNYKVGTNIRVFKDVLYPYLMMDERFNIDVQAYGEIKEHHVYAHVIKHVMDNGLRMSSRMMFMETDAQTFTAGVTGPVTKKIKYDVYWKLWQAINTMEMMGRTMKQNMIPNIHTISAQASYGKNFNSSLSLRVRGGLTTVLLGDQSRLNLLKRGDEDPSPQRIFIPINATLQYKEKGFFASVSLGQEAVPDEYLYITLKRMGKPSWFGNPYLKSPKRATINMAYSSNFSSGLAFSVGAYGHYVKDYVYLAKERWGMMMVMTYTNIDAVISGVYASANYKDYLILTTRYTLGFKAKDGSPLAEIAPWRVFLQANSPEWKGFRAYVKTVYNATQDRIDPTLGEWATPAWYRLDAGIQFEKGKWVSALEIRNITNQLYYAHLSYWRNPFSAGMPIYEPGRTLSISISYNLNQK
ncbi:MAG: hypothetical protein GXO48_04435 [Chlorobi bacterium]|nr:hypothetical protein [Chlorobiota bacterium]